MAAGLSTGLQVQRDLGLASEGVLRLCTLLSLAPPSSPDLNPLDYFVWSYVGNIINMTSHNTKASLIIAIRRVFAEFPSALVEKACSPFRIRIEVVIEAEGGYIELMSALLHNQVTWIDFFQAVVLFSFGQKFYRSTLFKRIGKTHFFSMYYYIIKSNKTPKIYKSFIFDGNYTRMLRAILNKSWR